MNNSICYQGCPALMSDGRQPGTDYRPSCYVHDTIRKQNNVNNNYDFKKFLQEHASRLQEVNRNFYANKNSCNDRPSYYLADPNEHIKYWDKYSCMVGYGNAMTFDRPNPNVNTMNSQCGC